MKDAEKISCPCGKKMTKADWDWVSSQYGEHVCGCCMCHKCNVFTNFPNGNGMWLVKDEDAGLTGGYFQLCDKCYKETSE